MMVKYWRWLEGNVECVLKAACQQYVPTNKNGKLNLVMTWLCIYIIVVPMIYKRWLQNVILSI